MGSWEESNTSSEVSVNHSCVFLGQSLLQLSGLLLVQTFICYQAHLVVSLLKELREGWNKTKQDRLGFFQVSEL